MQIHVKQGIEPIPVKEFGDPDANEKYHKTKKLGKNGNKAEDMYNFYGDYDLTQYFEPETAKDPAHKNLCLCQSTKKTMPIADVCLIVGQQNMDPRAPMRASAAQKAAKSETTIAWDVPPGFRKLPYSVGTDGVLNRLLCYKPRDLFRRKIKPRLLDHYPKNRHYYPLPPNIADFCFPQGVTLSTEAGQPEFFNFSIMCADGQ